VRELPLRACSTESSGMSSAALVRVLSLMQNKPRMVTDAPPRKKNRNLFTESDMVNTLTLPTDDRLRRIAAAIEAAIKIGKTPEVLGVTREFLDTAADFYQVKHCNLRVLEARPVRVKERSSHELFGDYHPDNHSYPRVDENGGTQRGHLVRSLPEYSVSRVLSPSGLPAIRRLLAHAGIL